MLKVDEKDFKKDEALPIIVDTANYLQDKNKEIDQKGLQKKACVFSAGLQYNEETKDWQCAIGAVGTPENIERIVVEIFDHPVLGDLFRIVAASKFLSEMEKGQTDPKRSGLIITGAQFKPE